jgi:hypothetical protein
MLNALRIIVSVYATAAVMTVVWFGGIALVGYVFFCLIGVIH